MIWRCEKHDTEIAVYRSNPREVLGDKKQPECPGCGEGMQRVLKEVNLNKISLEENEVHYDCQKTWITEDIMIAEIRFIDSNKSPYTFSEKFISEETADKWMEENLPQGEDL